MFSYLVQIVVAIVKKKTMINLNTCKIFFIIIGFVFTGCKTRTYINEKVNQDNDGTRAIEWDLIKNIREKKTGIYIYPYLGTTISLKKGKINGVFQIIENKDTIFYCNYVNNFPVGRYVKQYKNNRQRYKHGRTLPLKFKIDYEEGLGYFNQKHQKEGFWIEDNPGCIREGRYVAGRKEGVWKENCFKDVGGYTIYKNIVYKNDSIIKSVYGKGILTIDYKKEGYWEEYYPYCYQKGNYAKGKRIGNWEESCYDLDKKSRNYLDVCNKNESIKNKVFEAAAVVYQYEKDGYFEEFFRDCYKKGNYVNGLWKEEFLDINNQSIYKNVIYKNDTIVSSIEK